VLDDATLRYTGPTGATNRGFTIGLNGAAIEASGTGALTLSGAAVLNGTNIPRTLTLAGSNTADNTLSGAVPNNGNAPTSLLKDGPGTWVLAAANTFTGGVTIQQGTLKLGLATALNANTPNALGFSPTAVAGAKFQLNGFSAAVSSLTSTTAGVVVENGAAADATLTVSTWDDIRYQGALQDGAGGGKLGLSKLGAGTLELAGANTYTGPTEINAGTLLVTGSLAGTSSVSVGGTGRLEIEGTLSASVPLTIEAGGVLRGQGVVGPLSLLAGGSIAPGSSPGDLEAASLLWEGGGFLDFELGPTQLTSDQLSLAGAFTKGALGDFVFRFADLGVTPGLSYELVTFGSTDFVASDFQFVRTSPLLSGSFTVDSDSVNFVASVPEPTTGLLLLGAGALFALRRQRRA
jgi:autotransporter-associated beta strand protein